MKSPVPSLRSVAILMLSAAATTLPSYASAADYTWSKESDEGNFGDKDNWNVITYSEDEPPVSSENPATVAPSSSDKVIIDQAGSTVLINGDYGEYYGVDTLDFSAGTMKLSGSGVVFSSSGNQTISSSSGSTTTDYELVISDGANWSSANRIDIGKGNESITDVLLTGTATQLSANGYLIVGASGGTANITIADGATLRKDGGNELIFADGGSSAATVTATGSSKIESVRDVKIGWEKGIATVTLGDTAIEGDSASINISHGKYLYIGRVSNLDHAEANRGELILNGNSSVTLTSGGDATSAGEVWVGGGGGNGFLTLNDSSKVNTKKIHLAVKGGKGTLTLNNSSQINFAEESAFGLKNNGVAVVELNDNSKIVGTGSLMIGKEGGASGEVTLNGHAEISATGLGIGKDGGASGTLTLNDYSKVTISGDVFMARDVGTGKVFINNDATLSTGNFKIGQYSNNSIEVDAVVEIHDNGKLIVSSGLEVGYFGGATNGQLLMDGNAQVQITGGKLDVGTTQATGVLTMSDTSRITATAADTHGTVGGGNNAQASISLSNTAEIAAGNMKWTTGDFGGTGNGGSASITLADSSKLTLRELTIGHIGGTSASTNITVKDNATLTVNNFITLGRDDDTIHGGQASHLNLDGGVVATKYIKAGGGTTASTNNIVANGGTIKALESTDNFFRIATKTTTAEGQEPVVTNLSDTATHVLINTGGLTFDTQGFKVGVDTTFSGTGILTKVGTGTLGFNGTFAGETIVEQGTLGGTGTLGDITVKSGATLAPGNSVGTLTAGNVTLEAGATLVLEYEAGNIDQLIAASIDFAIGSNLFIAVLDGTGMGVGDVLTFTSSSVDLTGVNISGTDGYSFTYQGGNLIVTAVPEPSTYALLGAAGLLGLVALRRRRKE